MFTDCPQIPGDVADAFTRHGEDAQRRLSAEPLNACDAALEQAKRFLREHHLERRKAQQHWIDPDGRQISASSFGDDGDEAED